MEDIKNKQKCTKLTVTQKSREIRTTNGVLDDVKDKKLTVGGNKFHGCFVLSRRILLPSMWGEPISYPAVKVQNCWWGTVHLLYVT